MRPEGPLAGRGVEACGVVHETSPGASEGAHVRSGAAHVHHGAGALPNGLGGRVRVHVGLARGQVADEGVQRRQGAPLHVARQQIPLDHRRAV